MSIAHFSEGTTTYSTPLPLLDSQKQTLSLTYQKIARIRHQVLSSSCLPSLASGIAGSLITKNPLSFLVGLTGCFPEVLAQQKVGSQFPVNTYTPLDQASPSVSSLSMGRFVIVWEDNGGEDGSYSGVFGQIFNATGAKVGNQFQANTYTAGSQDFPSTHSLNNGNIVVTWTDESGEDGSGDGVFAQIFNATGSKVGVEFQVNTYTSGIQGVSTTTALSNGNFIISWTDFSGLDGNGYGIFGQLFSVTGSKVGSQFQANTYTTGDQYNSKVTALNNGDFVITWTDGLSTVNGLDGSGVGVFGQVFNATGSKVGSEFQVNTYTTGNQLGITIAALSNGSFVVVWEDDSGLDGSGFGVFGQIFNATAAKVGSEFQVNTYTALTQINPSASPLSNGNFVVTWSDASLDGAGYGIFGQMFNATGAKVGGEFQVNTDTTGNQAYSSVSLLSNGDFVVSWQDDSGLDGSGLGIFSQIFNTSVILSSTTGTTAAASTTSNITLSTGTTAVASTTSNILPSTGTTAAASTTSNITLSTGTTAVASTTSNILPSTGTTAVASTTSNITLSTGTTAAASTTSNITLSTGTTTAASTTSNILPSTGTTAVASTTSNITLSTGTTAAASTTSNITLSTGTTAAASTTSNILPSTGTTAAASTTSNKPKPLTTGHLHTLSGSSHTISWLGPVLGTLGAVACLGIGGASYLLYKRHSRDDDAQASNQAELGNVVSTGNNTLSSERKEKGHTEIGGKYELITKISREEADELYHQTGIKISFPDGKFRTRVFLGSGNFGKLRIARDRETNEFVAVKKIKGADEIQQSKNEGALQAKLNGKSNIMPILDFVESLCSNKEPVLYQFMPLAGFGTGEELMMRLENSAAKEQCITHVAQSLSRGLQGIHEASIYHLDLKPANMVLDNRGEVYIIDFGCAQELSDGLIREEALGDSRYFSPERLAYASQLLQNQTPAPIDASKVDAWALGLTLLELVLGEYPLDQETYLECLKWDHAYFQDKFGAISQLNNPTPGSLLDVVKGLLDVNPQTRLTIQEAQEILGKSPFADISEQEEAFSHLKQVEITHQIETPPPRRKNEHYGDVYVSKYGTVPSHFS